MALEPFFLEVVACPETHRPLRLADAELLAKLNAFIEKKKLKDKTQALVEPKLQTALVRDDGAVAYPVWDDVPRLLVESGIPLAQLDQR
ncbi:MAG: hypothetical protein Q8O67_02150 [Deltaproteobacteria bacterium]|nr:hypothetical protein [Deltaproteobacteria bacterium]